MRWNGFRNYFLRGVVFTAAALAVLGCGEAGDAADSAETGEGSSAAEREEPSADKTDKTDKLGTLRDEDFLTIRNPNRVNAEGEPRPEDQVEKELAMARRFVADIEGYLAENGRRKTIAEINKGRKGDLGEYFPEAHFYLSFSVNRGARKHWIIQAHPTLPSTIGYDIPDIAMVKDNTGWAYNQNILERLDAEGRSLGRIEGILWTDPEWSSGSCRMTAYVNIFEYDGVAYWPYFAVWLDK